MNKISFRQFSSFRQKFDCNLSNRNTKSWFPGHMYKGMLQMQAKLAVVDCIIEVHDARIPFSGRNPQFYSKLTAIKPHILILNKCDLIDPAVRNKIKDKLYKQNISQVIFTDCKASSRSTINKIIPNAVEMIKESEYYNKFNSQSFNLMVIGVPNVGKSSLINRLRNIHLNLGKASAVGATPGVTKSVLEKIKILDNPLVYLYDTPGVVEPSIDSIEVGLKLALCRILKDNLVGETVMADYLLYWLNKNHNLRYLLLVNMSGKVRKIFLITNSVKDPFNFTNLAFRYVKYFQLKEATDDVRIVLLHIAKSFNLVQKIRNAEGSVVQVPDILGSCNYFIRAFRDGEFGKLLLDSNYVNKIS